MLLTKSCFYLQLRVLSGEMPALELVLASLKVLSLLSLLGISPEIPALVQPQFFTLLALLAQKVQVLTQKYFLARLKG